MVSVFHGQPQAVCTDLLGPWPLLVFTLFGAQSRGCCAQSTRSDERFRVGVLFMVHVASPRSEVPAVQVLCWTAVQAGWAPCPALPWRLPHQKHMLPASCCLVGSPWPPRCNAVAQSILDVNRPRTSCLRFALSLSSTCVWLPW